MNLTIYSKEQDEKLVKVIVHEFFRAEAAFEQYTSTTLNDYINYQEGKRDIKLDLYRYNHYAMFVFHMYEYLNACFKRERKSTSNIGAADVEKLITFEVNKILRIWRESIEKGFAPSYANEFSYYDCECPEEFAKHFRGIRNNNGHADLRRIEAKGERISLSQFYLKYHKFLFLLFDFGRDWWTIERLEEVDLGDVSKFNLEIKKEF